MSFAHQLLKRRLAFIYSINTAWPRWRSPILPTSSFMPTSELLYTSVHHIWFALKRKANMIVASVKQRVMRKLAGVVASRSSVRAALVDFVLEKHCPEVLDVILQNHFSRALDALSK